jgi:hypothetical protein
MLYECLQLYDNDIDLHYYDKQSEKHENKLDWLWKDEKKNEKNIMVL